MFSQNKHTSVDLPRGYNSADSNLASGTINGGRSGRNYIIQGQTHCNRAEHPKPNSLDCWLRDNYAQNRNTNQAENEVIKDLVNTGDFEEGNFICPISRIKCKGIKIV